MEDPEVLMHLRPQNSQEKLLWERQSNKQIVEENKALKERNKQLENAISELKEQMKKEQIGALILKNSKLKQLNEEKDAKLKYYKREHDSLIQTIVRLQETGSISNQDKSNSSQ